MARSAGHPPRQIYVYVESRGVVHTRAARVDREAVVTVRHAAVPGRLRLGVAGLFRNPRRKPEIEDSLARLGHVSTVSANPLTGNVFLLYDPAQWAVSSLVKSAARVLDTRNGHSEAAAPFPPVRLGPALPGQNGSEGSTPHTPGSPAAPPGERGAGEAGPRWHALAAAEVARGLRADPQLGLCPEEVVARRRRFGPNRLPEPEEPSLLRLLANQLTNAPAALLVAGAVLSLGTGAVLDALLIGGVLAANAAIGALTERTGRRAIAALGRGIPIKTRVVRGGELRSVDADELVPGDLIQLVPGDRVPADARVLETHRLLLEESALTGESHAVRKDPEPVDAGAPLADRHSMAYRGTTVVGGHGKVVATATGSRTVLGELYHLAAQAAPPPTPLERDMDRLGRRIAVATGGIAVGVLGLGLLRGAGLVPSITTAIALGVSAVPEALPTLATTVLSLGSGRMRRKGTLIRSLSAAEALGSVTVVCADKTGTLTENRMAVAEIWTDGQAVRVSGPPLAPAGRFYVGRRPIRPLDNAALAELLRVGALCSDAEMQGMRNGELSIDGSPTEGALLILAATAGMNVDDLRRRFPRVDRRDRGEGRRHMVTVHRGPKGHVALAKGAPDEILDLCDRALVNGASVPISRQRRDSLTRRNSEMAGRTLRVLAFASKHLSQRHDDESLSRGFTWCGMVGLTDPIRPAAPVAVRALKEAGIRTVMITGDQAATARAVAAELGLGRGRSLNLLEAGDLSALDPEMLRGLVPRVDVFARVPPEMKLAIVRALQGNGGVVAMTGDGINDGPALRAADVGVAMGERGTELARELADVVLSTDDLSRMVDAVEEGRLVRASIRRVLHYLLGTNATEVWAVGTAALVGLPSPFTPAQLLWVNLVSDLFPVIGLAMEPGDRDLMRQPPNDPSEPVLPPALQRMMLSESATIAASALGAYLVGLGRHGPGAVARTMAFSSLLAGQLLYVPLARAGTRPALSYDRPFSRPMAVGLGLSALLQAGALFLPPLRTMLGCAPLSPVDGLISLVAGAASFLAIEAQRAARPARGEAESPGARIDAVEGRP